MPRLPFRRRPAKPAAEVTFLSVSEQARHLRGYFNDIPPSATSGGTRRNGFDGSTLDCPCTCHTVYGATRTKEQASRAVVSDCDHCRVYG